MFGLECLFYQIWLAATYISHNLWTGEDMFTGHKSEMQIEPSSEASYKQILRCVSYLISNIDQAWLKCIVVVGTLLEIIDN